MDTSCCVPHAEVSELGVDVTSSGVWYDWIGCKICRVISVGMMMYFGVPTSNAEIRLAIHNKQMKTALMGVVQLSF
jgi:hypothetical protein